MKKIKKYMYTLLIMIVSVFVLHNNRLLALEEVVINPNSNGEATYVYNVKEKDPSAGEKEEKYITVEKQFTKSRDIIVQFNISEEVLATYDRRFTICEIIPENTVDNNREKKECTSDLDTSQKNSIQLKGPGDGEKTIEVNLFENYNSQSITKTITKKIYLDTTAPVIDLNGGEYLYLTSKEQYKELGATCKDANDVVGYTCKVEIETANIDMNNPDFQYVRYTASDVLGNESTVYRKVLVEVKEKKSYKGWLIGGGFVLVVALISGYFVIKNKEKQKNQSVL